MASPLLTSLISYWPLNEASGNALDGHGSNNLTETSGTIDSAPGRIHKARDFELGDTEFFALADNASLSVTAGTGFTWSVWVNFESLPAGGGNEMAFVGKSDFGALTEYLLYSQFDGKFVFFAGNGAGGGANAIYGAIPVTGVWHNVIGWYDPAGGGTNNIQVNNDTPVSAANVGGIFDGTTEFRMGAAANNTRYFDGLMEEVYFWKRVLTSDERTGVFTGAYPFLPIGKTLTNYQAAAQLASRF